jgi:heptosyltransferase-2
MNPADIQRAVVLMPNWLGDGVMATPLLRGLRQYLPHAHLAVIANRLVAPAIDGLADVNGIHIANKETAGETRRWLRAGKFDLGFVLPNSFRAAWLMYQGNVRTRVGYARDGRGPLLTHRAKAPRRTVDQRLADRAKEAAIRQIGKKPAPPIGSPYQPLPAIDYYLALLPLIGCDFDDRTMQIAITDEDRAAMRSAVGEKSSSERWATFVPGANFGSSKCWPPERFAALAEQMLAGDLVDRVLLAGAPREGEIIDAIISALPADYRNQTIALPRANGGAGITVGSLKAMIEASDIIVCNDTGPRHFAAALRRPCVTLFGPTDPRWAETFSRCEEIVRIDVPCGPCQLKVCPIDHRCMQLLDVDRVFAAVRRVMASGKGAVDPRATLRQ